MHDGARRPRTGDDLAMSGSHADEALPDRAHPGRARTDVPLRIGVVGTGFMGETHVAAWAAEGIRAVSTTNCWCE